MQPHLERAAVDKRVGHVGDQGRYAAPLRGESLGCNAKGGGVYGAKDGGFVRSGALAGEAGAQQVEGCAIAQLSAMA